jgi:signal transduction histidine kinase
MEAESGNHSIVERLRLLNELARTVSTKLDIESLFAIILDRVSVLTGCHWSSITEYDPSKDLLRLAAIWQRSGESRLGVGTLLRPEDSVSGIALRTGVPCVLEDTREALVPSVQGLAERGILSLISVSIVIDGSAWGTLTVGFREAHAPTPEQVEFLEAIASHLATAVKNAQLYTQLQTAYDELRETQRKAIEQERLRALGQMASGIAHDLNNALVPVLGFSELLLDRPDALGDQGQVRRRLEMIRAGAQDAARVVSRLCEFSRRREEVGILQPVNLNRVVEQVISLTQPRWYDQALAAGISIRVDTDLQDVPLVAGNEAELREALVNVFFNAMDAMPDSGTITLRTRLDGPYVRVEVSDTGTGMSEGVREHCLAPTFSTKGECGSGLGLAMVDGVVQRHEGTINIESAEGKGTTVTICLRVHTAPMVQQPTAEVSAVSRALRVLVVDDEPMVREVVAAYLMGDGHIVDTAVDGREGLEKLRAASFDLVVTDRGMPRMGGDELAVAIKEIYPHTPVMLLTGFGDLMKATGDLPAGVDSVVGKPVGVADLRKAVATLLAR